MDRKIAVKRKRWKVWVGLVAVAGMAVVVYQALASGFTDTMRIPHEKLRIKEVQTGNFTEYIALTGYTITLFIYHYSTISQFTIYHPRLARASRPRSCL